MKNGALAGPQPNQKRVAGQRSVAVRTSLADEEDWSADAPRCRQEKVALSACYATVCNTMDGNTPPRAREWLREVSGAAAGNE